MGGRRIQSTSPSHPPQLILPPARAFQTSTTKEENLARAAQITALPSKLMLTCLQWVTACGWLVLTLPD